MAEVAIATEVVVESVNLRLAREVGILAGRLAQLLDRLPVRDEPAVDGRSFLWSLYESVSPGRPAADWDESSPARGPVHPPHPVDNLVSGLGLSRIELDLILLAGMADEHEGLSALFRVLHPAGEPRPTAGLAVQLFTRQADEREQLRALLTGGPAVTSGLLGLAGDGPFFERSLVLAEGVWPVLHGLDVWPEVTGRQVSSAVTSGLEDWFHEPAVVRVAGALADQALRTLLFLAESEAIAVNRASALADHAGVDTVCLAPAVLDAMVERLISLHASIRRIVPIVCVPPAQAPDRRPVASFERHPGPVVLCGRPGMVAVREGRPLLALEVDHLPVSERRRMWAQLLPELVAEAPVLAARYVVEPGAAATAAEDARSMWALDHSGPEGAALVSSFRARAEVSVSGGVKLRRPAAGWSQLVLAPDRLAQLREAVDRLRYQSMVLDDWQFLAGRPGARGVRMLFAGPPGTGKTLSAEVIARTIGVDLLVVDISRVVSKWIGETEKNLAEVFDAAERAQMVLFFDEADALFGKRTEVSDAHDRYANLETAYLLARLERCEGMVILATNFRQNVDPAFIRRLEFVVEFDEPGPREREALWRCHLPEEAPLDDGVSLVQLANLYPVVGGVIRNAAVAAAFTAAAEGSRITITHLVRAVRREYEKSGRPFPGTPFGVTAP
jgi:hypothetical protein